MLAVADDLDRFPEIATTREWRDRMRATRKAKGLEQAQLGAKVGVTQSLISQIETGQVAQSDRIIPICHVLEIDLPPSPVSGELDLRWQRVAARLRARSAKAFEAQLKSLEDLLDTLDGEE